MKNRKQVNRVGFENGLSHVKRIVSHCLIKLQRLYEKVFDLRIKFQEKPIKEAHQRHYT